MVKVKVMLILMANNKWGAIEQIIVLPSYRKSCMGFRLEYLHLSLADSKDQGIDHANFD